MVFIVLHQARGSYIGTCNRRSSVKKLELIDKEMAL